jgi:hypothetical protein
LSVGEGNVDAIGEKPEQDINEQSPGDSENP